MIIKITVHDNDYYCKIMHFMERMWSTWCDEDTPVDEKIEAILKADEIREYINPNSHTKLTPEIKEKIINYLKDNFVKYLESKDNIFEDTKQYLIKHLEITIQDTFKDRWENGEAFYWLQHSNVIINQ